MGPENKFPQQEKRRVAGFKTSQDSTYEYLSDGRTSRFETASNKQHEAMDTIVFIYPWGHLRDWANKNYPEIFKLIESEASFKDLLLSYVRESGKTIRITNENGLELLSNKEIQEAIDVFILCLDKIRNDRSFYLPVSKDPEIGYQVYDTSKYTKNIHTVRESHIGNPITEIEYAD